LPIAHRGEYFYAEQLFSVDENLFNDAAQRIADVFTQVADGKLPREDLQTRLDTILSRPDRLKLLEELQEKQSILDKAVPPTTVPTVLKALEDLFYGFSLDLEEYRFGKRLLSLDQSRLGRSARQMAQVYMDVIEGKFSPSEITPRLDKILSKDDRDKLIERLRKQQAAHRK